MNRESIQEQRITFRPFYGYLRSRIAPDGISLSEAITHPEKDLFGDFGCYAARSISEDLKLVKRCGAQ